MEHIKQSASVDANGVFSYMSSFEFLITLHIVRNCLAYVYPLTYELQQKKIDILYPYIDLLKMLFLH